MQERQHRCWCCRSRIGDLAGGSALIAAVALALLDLGLGVGLPVLRERAAHVILLRELPLLVAAGVALVLLVRLDQLAVSCHKASLTKWTALPCTARATHHRRPRRSTPPPAPGAREHG